MPSLGELVRLVAFPNESLTVEYKSWLTLHENHDRATLAKAAIALANHGGGVIVLGMRPINVEGGALASQLRPVGLGKYSQDDINAAINRYADPRFHCELLFATHPETNVEHAFVSVPGGLSVPAMSTRDCEGVIAQQRCYIRKPGPRSEEPFRADEWRALLDRCLRNGRENMLDAIRAIVQGHAGGLPNDGLDALQEFAAAARQRWDVLVEALPEEDPGRMSLGHYELSFGMQDVPAAPNLNALRDRLHVADAVKHTGWGPFVNLHREPFEPRPRGSLIEAWLGALGADRFLRTPAHCDFWQAHQDGRLFLLRGFDEDSVDYLEPGSGVELTIPIWRVGEAALYAARLARQFDEDPKIVIDCRYSGLLNRKLARIDRLDHFFFGEYHCDDNQIEVRTQALTSEIEDNLAEVIHPLLAPFYEKFSFYELPMDLVVRELNRMRQNHF